jgi:hypothetical protein
MPMGQEAWGLSAAIPAIFAGAAIPALFTAAAPSLAVGVLLAAAAGNLIYLAKEFGRWVRGGGPG